MNLEGCEETEKNYVTSSAMTVGLQFCSPSWDLRGGKEHCVFIIVVQSTVFLLICLMVTVH